jgi:plasmid stability protein
MMTELLIEGVPDEIVALLVMRAQAHQRSVEDEVPAIPEETIRGDKQAERYGSR